MQVSKIEIKGSNKSELKVTEVTQIQKSILEVLDCENVMEKKVYQKSIKQSKKSSVMTNFFSYMPLMLGKPATGKILRQTWVIKTN